MRQRPTQTVSVGMMRLEFASMIMKISIINYLQLQQMFMPLMLVLVRNIFAMNINNAFVRVGYITMSRKNVGERVR